MVTVAHARVETPPQAAAAVRTPSTTPDPEFHSDLPLALAVAAWGEEAPAKLVDYGIRLASDLAALAPLADTTELQQVLETEFFEYRRGLQVRMIAYLTGLARKASPAMIGGPTRFPVPKAGLGVAAEVHENEIAGYRTRALARIKEELRTQPGPVVDGPSDKLAELQRKLAAAEANHERMKEVNAAIRRLAPQGREAQLAALAQLGVDGLAAEALLVPYGDRVGYRESKMRNSLSEIERLSRRVDAVIAARARGMTEERGVHARIELIPGEQCIRLFFEGKRASRKYHAELREAGFKPRAHFWAGPLDETTVALARKIAGIEAA